MLAVVPVFAFGFDWHLQKDTWTRSHYMPELLALLREQREQHLAHDSTAPRELLILDNSTSRSYKYYLNIHPASREANRAFFRKNFRMVNVPGRIAVVERYVEKRLRRSKRPFWLFSSKHPYMDPLEQYARRTGRVIFEKRIGTDHMMLYIAPK